MKSTETEWKMKICLLTLYFNQCNERSLCFEGSFLFFFLSFFSYGIVELICEHRHTFFISLRLRQKLNLRPSALFHNNLRSEAGKFAHSVVCGNTHAPPHHQKWFSKSSLFLIKKIISTISIKFFLNASLLDN